MGKTKDLGHLAHIVAYDTENHITVPAGITMHTNQLVASQSWVTTALGSYALSSSLGSYVPTSRTITINGTTLDLSANRSFTIAAGLSSFNTRTGDVTLSSTDVTTALGYTPVTNARTITINGTTWDLSADRSFTVSAGTTLNGTGFVKASGTTITYDNSTYLTGITSALVTGALGFTPYNATNPSGYITGISFANVSAKPTTLSGYGITDAASAGHQHDTLHYNGSARLWTGSDGTRNSGWAYHQDNGTGLHWPNNGWHLYPKDASDFYIRSGSTSESSIALNTGGTTRGYVYVNSSNQIGFLNNDRNWVFKISSTGDIVMDYNYGASIIGVYSSTRYQGVWSMGNAYKLSIDGSSPGNLYGLSWSHPNAGGQAGYLNDHGLMIMVNGVTYAAISSNIWARGNITANGQFNGSGAGLSGTASSLTAGAANSVAWGNVSSKPGWMTSASLIEAHANANDWRNSGFYENSGGGSNWPSGTWYNSVNVRHSNQGNYHGFQIAMSYYDNLLWFRSYQGSGSFQSWAYAISSQNIGSQSVNYASTSGGASSANSLSTNASANNIYNSGWFRNYGDSGLYNQDYGCHLVRNNESSHGAWSIFGYTKAGYIGMNLRDPQTYNNNLMYENGNGGMYTENANGWQWYYNRGSNCLGLGGSTTYNWVRAVVNGKLKIESDSIHTGWAYFDSNTQLAGGGNTLYNEYNYWYVWRNWGGWGGEWINRNGGDMIMNLYAVYSVTGSISDIRYKKDVTALSYGLNEIMQLNPIKYHYNLPKESMLANDPDYFLGFSAQEVQSLIPEAVHEKMGSDNKDGMLAITYDELIPVLVNGIKEQQVMIHNQNIKINKLEALVNQLLNN